MVSELAQVLADIPDLAHALLQEHARTPEGRCPVCMAGPQGGHVVHPCGTWSVASAALAEIARKRTAS